MADLNLEIQHTTGHGVSRITHPIARPKGMDEEQYALHAQGSAKLVAEVLTGEPGSLLRVTGVVMMVVEEGRLIEEEICDQLSEAADRYDRAQTWREAHVIRPRIPKTTV